MPRIAILTPNPKDEAAEGRWSEVYQRMVAPLAPEGVEVEGRSWTDAGDLTGFDLVMPMVIWGYHRQAAQWIEAVTKWQQAGVKLANHPDVLRWNTDKRYLGRLLERGAPVIPTLFVDRADEAAVADAFATFGADRLVVKPQISASAYRTLRLFPGEPIVDGPKGAALIQPYMSAIETEGEVSLFYFDRAFSHAIRKVPKAEDFRVQPEWGGNITTIEAPAEARAAAEQILAVVDEPLLYARIDLTRDPAGAWVLVELELIEPDLYLGHAPDKGAMFARAVAKAAEGG
ncbi:MAG: ATP-grasp domain-containing protein [Caulobacteraceae bacterium]